ncbi:glycosyltransferase family 2 protein [Poseidonocella sp. HB161398]|uniref:glycosyltransferase family 2 protein n=1 Tax=Poseidonocella sp. HB161398 TaxID=2320855 RepID=UPI001108C730|nr:glycosyltransferase family 2 protein [Poseidonocella sp. HB161398]
MMKDEEFFLPIWFRYYSEIFGGENLFILDNGSSKAPAEMLPTGLRGTCINVFQIPPREETSESRCEDSFDNQRFGAISGIVNGLLSFYDFVLFNDTDEIFMADPARYRNLAHYLEQRAAIGEIRAGVGLELFHDRQSETAFDPEAPIFSQRRNVFASPLYTKPHVLGRKSVLRPHAVAHPFTFDPDLYLFHLRFVDVDRLRLRQAKRRALDAAGAVGWGPWKWDDEGVVKQLARMERRPLAETPFSGATQGEMLFGQSNPVKIGGDNGAKRIRRPTPKKWRFIDYVSRKNVRLLRQQRHVLPDSFSTSGV